MSFGQPSTLPRWAQLTILPVLNLMAALLVTGAVTWMIGENPLECLKLLIDGAFGYGEGIGYTLFYTTGFIFTGLAVATAFHAGLFNIGGEGQAYLRFATSETRIDLDRAIAEIIAAVRDFFALSRKEAPHG